MKGILNKLLLVAVVCGVVEANAARSLQNLQKAFGNYVATGVSAAQQVAKHKVKLGVGAFALAAAYKKRRAIAQAWEDAKVKFGFRG